MMQKNKQVVPLIRFKEFEGSWSNNKIRDFYTNLRTGMTPYRGKPEYYTGHIPWITSGELNYNHIEKTNETISESAVKETNLKLYPPGTFFIAITGLEAPGTRGKCAINAVPATTNQSCMAFEKNDKVNTLFLYFWYNKFGIPLYYRFAQGTKQQSFNNRIVEDFTISLPTLPEQQKIAAFLTAVDDKIQQLTRKKELLEQYKKGVMQQLFKQELRFKDEQGNDYPAWEEKKLGEVASFSKGKGISKTDIDESGKVECIRYGQLYTIYSETISSVVSKTNVQVEELVLSEENDIIIPASGETLIDIAKASCVMKSGVALGGDLNIIKTSIDGVFLSYYLNNAKKKDIARLAQGISVVHLYASQLKLLKLKIPSLLEQQKIASFLSSIDQKIEQVGVQLAKAKEWKKGLLQKMFV